MADNRKSTAASFIDKVFVVKNKGRRTSRGTRGRKTVDVANGVVNLKYFESLLQDHVVMEYTIRPYSVQLYTVQATAVPVHLILYTVQYGTV